MRALLITLLAITALSVSTVASQDLRTPKPMELELQPTGAVYVVPIEGMIDNALASYLDRAVNDAVTDSAAAIVFHVDTFGGLVDAADEIRGTILDAPIPTVAFIDKNAASAGALISYANDRIAMAPGSSIGAATVVEGVGGQAAPDKYQSYMRSQMRATAEANGRDPAIAAAMVDPDLSVPGVSDSGKVLTLSSEEAFNFGVSDVTIGSLDELLTLTGLADRPRVAHTATRTEKVLRFFVSPVIQSILMLMMMGGLYFELQSPGVGFPGIMALLGASLFFAPHYANGLVESWEILLFVVGAGLIAAELFVVPGFGIAGISGIICVVAALLFGLVGNVGLDFPSAASMSSAITTLAVTMVLFVLLLVSLGRYLPKTNRFKNLILQPELASAAGYIAASSDDSLLGKLGVTVTPLRPAGTVEIDGQRIDVVSQSEFIPTGTTVEVLNVKGSKVEVRPSETPNSNET